MVTNYIIIFKMDIVVFYLKVISSSIRHARMFLSAITCTFNIKAIRIFLNLKIGLMNFSSTLFPMCCQVIILSKYDNWIRNIGVVVLIF